jgi:hypothetical protein
MNSSSQGAGQLDWPFAIACPTSRGHVVYFSIFELMSATNAKQASNGY